jgi:hypothetical protein
VRFAGLSKTGVRIAAVNLSVKSASPTAFLVSFRDAIYLADAFCRVALCVSPQLRGNTFRTAYTQRTRQTISRLPHKSSSLPEALSASKEGSNIRERFFKLSGKVSAATVGIDTLKLSRDERLSL